MVVVLKIIYEIICLERIVILKTDHTKRNLMKAAQFSIKFFAPILIYTTTTNQSTAVFAF